MSKPMKNMTQTSSDPSETSTAIVLKNDASLIQNLLRKCVNDTHQDAFNRAAQLDLKFKLFQQLMLSKSATEGGRKMINLCARMANEAVQDYGKQSTSTVKVPSALYDDDSSEDDA